MNLTKNVFQERQNWVQSDSGGYIDPGLIDEQDR